MTKYDLKNKLRLQLSDDMREFAILNNLTEQDIIKSIDLNYSPDHLILDQKILMLTKILLV